MTKSLLKQWTIPVSKNHLRLLIEQSATDRQKARLQGVNCRRAGGGLNALPSNPLGLCLHYDQFRIACGIKLGAPASTKYRCLCGTTLDSYGTHALVCPRITSMFTRHTICNEVFRDAFKTAQIPVTLEPTGLLRADERRPDGTTLTPWQRGKPIAWDFTCVNRLATPKISSGKLEGPVIANIAEDKKINNYLAIIDRFALKTFKTVHNF